MLWPVEEDTMRRALLGLVAVLVDPEAFDL
jgi:hypothetical protein